VISDLARLTGVLLIVLFVVWVRRSKMWLARLLHWCAAVVWDLVLWVYGKVKKWHVARDRARRRARGEHLPREEFTAAERAEAIRRAGGQCEWWWEMPDGTEVRCQNRHRVMGCTLQCDHVVAAALDGPADLVNAQALCPDCNLRKSDKPVTHAYLDRLYERRKAYYLARPIPDPGVLLR
jgi:5-methylcytosine-specific restriction endonuclease McrA